MIPADVNELIPFVDESDDITYYIQPMAGDTEYQCQVLLAPLRNKSDKERDDTLISMDITNQLFDLFVKGWKSNIGKKVIAFPEDQKPSKLFKMVDKNKMVFDVILGGGINKLTVDEKKS